MGSGGAERVIRSEAERSWPPGAASPEDFDEADAIREKLDRRLRALAGQRGMPPDPPPSSPPRP